VQRICIRALDYCPPFDITFGEFLRGIITADFDMVANDTHGYRVAFVEAFQKRGISADGILSMAVEDLLHPLNPVGLSDNSTFELGKFLRGLKNWVGYLTDRRGLYEQTKMLLIQRDDRTKGVRNFLQKLRKLVEESTDEPAVRDLGKEITKLINRRGLHRLFEDEFIHNEDREAFESLTGLRFFPAPRADKSAKAAKDKAERLGFEWGYLASRCASFAIGNVSLANRVTPDDTMVNHVIITLVQKRGVRFSVDGDDITVDEKGDRGDHIIFRGGCTLVFDLDTQRLRYAIKKDIDDRERMIRQFRFEQGLLGEDDQTYFDSQTMTALAGPFAFTHSHHPTSEDRT
jgi:hypothetical protein